MLIFIFAVIGLWLVCKFLRAILTWVIGFFLFVECFGYLNHSFSDGTSFALSLVALLIGIGLYKALRPAKYTAEQAAMIQQIHDRVCG